MTESATLVASVLDADLGRIREVCVELEQAGVDAIQWDVMDGRFVPNLTMGPQVIAACRSATSLFFEAHLMIVEPERYVEQYVDAGCRCVIVHAEATTHLHRTLDAIRSLGAQAGVALNPATPLDAVVHVLDMMDLLLVMTVNPGFGGQSYIATMEAKIAEARALVDSQGRDVPVEVDGGISPATVRHAAAAGATRFVVGSALYKGGGPSTVVPQLRAALAEPVEVALS